MEIINNNYIPNKNDKVKKIEKAAHKKEINTTESHSLLDSNDYYHEITTRVQRSITKDQVVLAGLETIRSFIESGMEKEESISFLKEIIDKTQFDNEKVLKVYKQSLVHALEQGNPGLIKELIKNVQGNIDSLTEELEMNEIKKQNLRSLKSLAQGDNPEKLMQEVLQSLREEGLPEIKITRDRIVDLLGD